MAEVASAYVTVLPSARGFRASLQKQIGGDASRIGQTSGRQFGSSFTKSSHSFLRGTAGAVLGIGIFQAVKGLGKAVIGLGISYQDSLNTFQAVSHATAGEMRAVAAEARNLGNDLTLPATSAADAAQAMTELAKGGLSVRESLKAAKGTLQLAAAAQVDGASAAQIQANALNEFRLGADRAGHVADVLANVANAASGEITDVANALSFVGPVAKSAGVSLDDTGTAIGLLAKNGVLASKAGTGLRGILSSLSKPSTAGAKALKTLGIEAFDSQGHFVGFRKVIDDLSVAQRHLTDEQFGAAAGTAFSRQQLAAVNILAAEGTTGFDEMAKAVGRQGGAADVAAAKTKGFGGALQGLQSQFETIAIDLFTRAQPVLENLTRDLSSFTDGLTGSARASGDAADAGRLVGGVWKADVVPALRTTGEIVKSVTGFLAEHKTIVEGAAAAYIGFKSAALALRVVEGVTASVSRLSFAMASSSTAAGRMAGSTSSVAARIAGGAGAGAAGGPVGIALTAALTIGTIAFGKFAAKTAEAKAFSDGLRSSLNAETGAITTNTRAYVANKLQKSGLLDLAREIGLSFSTVTDAATGNAKAQDIVAAATKRAREEGTLSNFEYLELAGGVLGLSNELRDQQKAQRDVNAATQRSTSSFKAQAATVRSLGPEFRHLGRDAVEGIIQGANERTDALARTFTNLGNAAQASFARANESSSPSRKFMRLAGDIMDGLELGVEKFTPHVVRRMQSLSDQMRDVLRDKKNGLSATTEGVVRDMIGELDDGLRRVDRLLASRATLRGQFRSTRQDVVGSLLPSADITGFGTTNPAGVITGLTQSLRQERAFKRDIATLRKQHFDKRLIDTLAGKGLEAAPLVANLARARGGQLRQIEGLSHEFRSVARSIGQSDAEAIVGPKLDKNNDLLRDMIHAIRDVAPELADLLDGVARRAGHKGKP